MRVLAFVLSVLVVVACSENNVGANRGRSRGKLQSGGQGQRQPTEVPSDWPNERSAETDCDGTSCEERVISVLADGLRGNRVVLLDNTFSTVVGYLELEKEDNQWKGRFKIRTNFGVSDAPILTQGEFAVRNGRLALRSDDKEVAAYFRWYPVDINGTSHEMLFGEVPSTSGTVGFWIR